MAGRPFISDTGPPCLKVLIMGSPPKDKPSLEQVLATRFSVPPTQDLRHVGTPRMALEMLSLGGFHASFINGVYRASVHQTRSALEALAA